MLNHDRTMMAGKAGKRPTPAGGEKLSAAMRRFVQRTDGNVAMMFGLAIIGVMGATGLAVDFTRQSNASSALQAAVDSAALSAVKEVGSLNAAQLSARAQATFDAPAANGPLAGMAISAVYTALPTKTLRVSVESSIPSMFGGLFGVGSLPLKAAAVIPISTRPAEIALVMDNTGSMSGQGKMSELKKAATNLVNAMQSASTASANEIRISLVPFAKSVNIGESNVDAPWIDWSSYSGRKLQWKGCVDDRNQPHDVTASKPTGDSYTWYPAASNCNLASIMPMTTDWGALKGRISAMTPTGTTNLTIGLAWGLNMMTPGAPLSTASPEPEKYSHYMILLTDGLNTQNRWTSNAASIDARTLEACARVKAAGVQLFTVRVIDGNRNLLRACASSPDMFYDVSDAAELSGVFEKIGTTVMSALYLQR